MLRILTLAPILAAVLALGGCSTIAGGTSPSPVEIQTTVNSTIAQVQSIATTLCRYEPTAATVASIIANLAGAGPVVDTASSVASSICAAVTKTGARRGAGVPRAYGVPVHGRFVRG